ncbi:Cofilin/tropomyosin-type actin-binding protein-domain-containing protein [Lactarius pseudohatsudake]|nr:Cofilin/tropomyosin-type actin-binding protein-domain-containing protein [Lactarius pseudohatsudake]
MSSGVGVNPACLEAYQKLKLGKKLKYIIFTLNKDKTEIIVEKESIAGDYEDFTEDLPASECRWAVFDLEFNTDDGKRNKLVFVSWSPDTAKIKDKMVASSSKDALRRSLVGIAVDVQATEFSEVAHETVLIKAGAKVVVKAEEKAEVKAGAKAEAKAGAKAEAKAQ